MSKQINMEKDYPKIMRMCIKHKFYVEEVLTTLMRSEPENKHLTVDANKVPIDYEVNLLYKDENIAGFYIQNTLINNEGHLPNTLCLEFIFILPEYRREGLCSKHIKSLQQKYDEIWVDTKNNDMIKCINKLGFKFQRMSLNQIELAFRWC